MSVLYIGRKVLKGEFRIKMYQFRVSFFVEYKYTTELPSNYIKFVCI